MPAPAPETYVPSLLALWRGDDFASNTVVDQSPEGNNLTSTNVTIVTSSSPWKPGIPLLSFIASGAGSKAVHNVPATWNAFHNGSGATFWAAFCPLGPGPLGNGIDALIGTGNVFSSEFGFQVRLDTTRKRIGIEFVNGEGSGYLIDNVLNNWWSWDNTIVFGVPHILVITISNSTAPNIQIWLDGKLIASVSKGDREKDSPSVERPWGTGDASRNLTVGQTPQGFNSLTADFAEIGMMGAVLSTQDRKQLEAWAAEQYGVKLRPRTNRGRILWNGNSLVDNIWRTDQFAEQTTRNLRQNGVVVMRAIAGLQSHQMTARHPKHVAPMYDASAPFNVATAWELVNDIAEGKTKEQALADYWATCDLMRAQGWKVVCAPMPPHRFTIQATFDWLLAAVIAEWGDHADAICRFDVDPRLGGWNEMVADYGANAGPKVYRSDGVHFTVLGNQLVAPYWRTAIDSVLPPRLLF